MKEYLKPILAGAVGALFAIIIYTGILFATGNQGFQQQDSSSVKEVLIGENVSIPDVIARTSPSVVQISRSSGLGAGSLGSGVIVDGSLGYVITNYHVVGETGDLTVNLLDGRVVKAERVGSDPDSDLAVLKLEDTSNLTEIELGDSSNLKVGQTAIAIGSPLSLDFANTVTLGVISAVEREVTYFPGSGNEVVLSVIQTDAAINPGNSGGALINILGQLIGINSVKISANDVEGMGFAIPINTVKPIVEEIIRTGKVSTAYLGVSNLVNINESMSTFYDIPVGVLVGDVAPGSPASKAGIRINDIILNLEGQDIATTSDLLKALRDFNPGDRVDIKISRNGKELTLMATLE